MEIIFTLPGQTGTLGERGVRDLQGAPGAGGKKALVPHYESIHLSRPNLIFPPR